MGKKSSRPTERDFDEVVIGRSLLAETALDPIAWTGVGTAAVGGTVIALGLSNPVGWVLLGGGSALAGGVWIYRAVNRKKARARHIQKLFQKRRDFDLRIVNELVGKFNEAGWQRGVNESEDLNRCYSSLVNLLESKSRSNFNDPEVVFWRTKADELYELAVFNLSRALDMYVALTAMDVDKLQRELEAEEERCRRHPDNSGYAEALKIARERRDRYTASVAKLEERLRLANQYESIFEESTITLGDLGVGSEVDQAWADAANSLAESVRAAAQADKDFQEELTK